MIDNMKCKKCYGLGDVHFDKDGEWTCDACGGTGILEGGDAEQKVTEFIKAFDADEYTKQRIPYQAIVDFINDSIPNHTAILFRDIATSGRQRASGVYHGSGGHKSQTSIRIECPPLTTWSGTHKIIKTHTVGTDMRRNIVSIIKDLIKYKRGEI